MARDPTGTADGASYCRKTLRDYLCWRLIGIVPDGEPQSCAGRIKLYSSGHQKHVSLSGKPIPGTEVKIFDPRDTSTGSDGVELLDATVVQRDQQWWMYLAGQPGGFGATDIFSASLAVGAPLSATGWKPTRDAAGKLAPVCGAAA